MDPVSRFFSNWQPRGAVPLGHPTGAGTAVLSSGSLCVHGGDRDEQGGDPWLKPGKTRQNQGNPAISEELLLLSSRTNLQDKVVH